jgi:hypothetical protein
MIICPNCEHENPEGATLCETCYTPLPINLNCPNCGGSILSNATFCGQCGFSLKNISERETIEETVVESSNNNDLESDPDSTIVVELEEKKTFENFDNDLESQVGPTFIVSESEPELMNYPNPEPEISLEKELVASLKEPTPSFSPKGTETKLQISIATFLHVQTNTIIELPQNLPVIHVGKSGGPIPPDIDVSGLPDSQYVSRVHADIRVEPDGFYIEDVGSSNGTYINHIPLPPGNRHRLRVGDRIALGKEDKVSFIFQING